MKNPLIVILLIIAIVSSVISCQKEFSIDDVDVLDQKASGTLTDSSGNCFSDSVHGNFFNGVVPKIDSDFVELRVNVDTPGLYNIKTDLQNGFMFADSGYFTTVGVNKITLKPIGTPIIPTQTYFTVSFDESLCNFIVNVKDSSNTEQSNNAFAKGTLKDNSGNCMPIAVKGTYYNGKSAGDTNYVNVKVNVSSIGNYSLITPSENGYFFWDSGFFSTTGNKTIKLKASGTPVSTGINTFSITFDSSTCTFDVTVSDTAREGNGKASYTASSDLCSSAQVYGNYYEGTALNSSNKIRIDVNVTTPGTFSISTSSSNGMVFASKGRFPQTGLYQVDLQGSGTPTTSGSTGIPISIGTNTCNITVNVSESNSSADTSENYWSFTEGNQTFSGGFASAEFGNPPLGEGKLIDMYGLKAPAYDTVFILRIQQPSQTTAPVPGTYYTDPSIGSLNFSDFSLYYFNINQQIIFLYESETANNFPDVKMAITIDSYDPDTQIVKGQFSGKCFSKSGYIVDITNGKFKCKVAF